MKLMSYSEYKDAGVNWIGSVPAHWLERRAKYYFKEIDDRSQTGDEEMLSVSHITGVTPRSQKSVNMFKAESNVGQKRCQPGDLIINTMWAWMSALGVSNYAGIVSPAYGVYRLKNSQDYDCYYLDHLLRIEDYRSEYIVRSTGIRSSRLRLYPDKFLSMRIVCPPLDEQKAITKFLKAKNYLFRKFIHNKRQLIGLLKEQKHNIIKQAVTKGINPNAKLKPSGVKWIGDIPEHWSVLRLKFLARIKNGRDYKEVEAQSGYPVIGSGGQFAFATEFVYEGESVLFGRKGTIDKPLYINGRFWTVDTMFYTQVSKNIFAKFLYCCSLSFPFEFYSTKTALPSMTQEDLGNHPVAFPPKDEQKNIVQFIENESLLINEAITRAEKEIDLIRAYRARLISDVVTGKVDVRNVVVPEINENELPTFDVELGEIDEEIISEESLDEAD